MNLFILYFKSLKSGALHVNAVPFLCPMALNLHQKRPSPVTSGWLFHRAIRREIAAPSSVLMAMVQQSYPCHPSFHRATRHEIAVPSFVLMGDGAAKLPPSSAIPPRNTTQNCGAIIRFDGDGARELPPWGLYFFNFPHNFPIDAHSRRCVNYDDVMP